MTARVACLCVALAACAPPAGTARVREVELPAAYEAATPAPSVGAIDWRTFFADDQLSALIGEALTGNYDLQITVQRIAIARAAVLESSGARLPRVAFVASAGIQKFGRYTMDGAGNATTDITPGQRVPTHLTDLAAGLEAGWELDLWGRLRDLEGAARARYLETIEGTYLVVTNLVADVATAYYELVALDRTQEILNETITRQTQALEIMQIEKQAGRTNELAVRQFEAQLAGTKALSAATLRDTREVENAMNLLLGRPPRSIGRAKDALQREVPRSFAAGVPSDLLRNRPDIRAAELAVQAARLDLTAARAAFYPRIAISAAAGYEAFNPRFLLSTPASLAYSLGASLVAPLVNRRGIRAAFETAQATQLQAMYNYQGVVLRGFIEVATGLFALQQAADVVTQVRARVDAVADTVDAADALFRAGKATYLEVLLAQQNKLDAELQLVTALRDQHIAAVRLYKALGGGWRGSLRLDSGT